MLNSPFTDSLNMLKGRPRSKPILSVFLLDSYTYIIIMPDKSLPNTPTSEDERNVDHLVNIDDYTLVTLPCVSPKQRR